MDYGNGFEIDMDFGAETAKARPNAAKRREERSQKSRQKEPVQAKPAQGSGGTPAGANTAPPAANTTDAPRQESAPPAAENTAVHNMSRDAVTPDAPDGFGQTRDGETPGAPAEAEAPAESELTHIHEEGIDWRAFKTMKGLFEHVGGYRPVQLAESVKRTSVSGQISPLYDAIKAKLAAEYTGATMEFPWGTYTITDKHPVFNMNSALTRYLMFDGLRDADGTHVQYAKQWLALHHSNVFDANFRSDVHMSGRPESDALDIYVLLYVSHSVAVADGVYQSAGDAREDVLDGYQIETLEQVQMANQSMTRLLEGMRTQEELIRQQADRSQMMQTVLLLDRMGLLKGGIPRDVDGFTRLLEESRDALSRTESIVDKHIEGEARRRATYDSEQRKAALQQKYK